MLSNITFFLIISAFGIWALFKYDRSYEETIPLSCMGIVLVIFIFGMLGHLYAGVIVAVAVCAVFWILALAEIVKNRHNFKNFIKHKICILLTPGTVIFTGLFVLFNYIYIGQYVWLWDEFSHWADIVKVMTTLDDFGTNPMAASIFPHYPPAMAIFEYFLQEINLWFKPTELFSEWRVYLAYHVFFATLFMPLLNGVKWKNVFSYISLTLLAIAFPITFFNILYYSVYIDGFLSVATGAAFAMILCREDKDFMYHLYIWLSVFTIIMTKEVGTLLAGFVLAMYIADVVICGSKLGNSSLKNILLQNKWKIIPAAILFFLPKILWNNYIGERGVGITVDLETVADIVMGQDTTYRGQVYDLFIDRFFQKAISVNFVDISLSYLNEIVLAVAFIAIAIFVIRGKKTESTCHRIINFSLLILLMTVYIVGICVMYVFNFSEYEALKLAEFDRYINIILLVVYISALSLIWKKAQEWNFKSRFTINIAIIVIVIAVMPFWAVKDSLRREYVNRAYSYRLPTFEIAEKIMAECPPDDNPKDIMLVAEGKGGYEGFILKLSIRPNEMHWIEGYIGMADDADENTKVQISPEQFKKQCIDKYDYVAIYNVNNYFLENYAVLFENPQDIAENQLYKVNKETGLLVLIQ